MRDFDNPVDLRTHALAKNNQLSAEGGFWRRGCGLFFSCVHAKRRDIMIYLIDARSSPHLGARWSRRTNLRAASPPTCFSCSIDVGRRDSAHPRAPDLQERETTVNRLCKARMLPFVAESKEWPRVVGASSAWPCCATNSTSTRPEASRSGPTGFRKPTD